MEEIDRFIARRTESVVAERAIYGMFVTARTGAGRRQTDYRFECPVILKSADDTRSSGRIDLCKRDRFVVNRARYHRR